MLAITITNTTKDSNRSTSGIEEILFFLQNAQTSIAQKVDKLGKVDEISHLAIIDRV